MAIPDEATGYGNQDTANVFRLTFDQTLSSAPIWEAYDNSSSFPAVDASGSTIAGALFIGTTVNSEYTRECF